MYSKNLFFLNPCSKDQRKEHNEVIIGFATSCPSHTILLQKLPSAMEVGEGVRLRSSLNPDRRHFSSTRKKQF